MQIRFSYKILIFDLNELNMRTLSAYLFIYFIHLVNIHKIYYVTFSKNK